MCVVRVCFCGCVCVCFCLSMGVCVSASVCVLLRVIVCVRALMCGVVCGYACLHVFGFVFVTVRVCDMVG